VTAARRDIRLLAADAALVCLLVAAKLAIDAGILRAGFSHVSDDDYARTVIAEQFAYSPHLDPSGTSWLPLPFWIVGAAMGVAGRSLGSAQAIAIALGAIGVLPPFVAMRAVRVPPGAAFAATLVAMAIPWSAWLGVATVPDGWTGALIAAGAIAMADRASRPWAAAAFFVASLSRYEAWPACALLALLSVRHLVRRAPASESPRSGSAWRDAGCAALAVAGPVLWMAWNAHAHGSPFHFFARVSAFRRAIGAADVPFHEKLLGYPIALAQETPEAAILGALGLAGQVFSRSLRLRWRWPTVAALAILAFLVAGDLGDGAPTHHPARALVCVAWILIGMGIDAVGEGMRTARGHGQRAGAVAVAAVAIGWLVSLPSRWAVSPGSGDLERRDVQIARGLDLRARDAASAVITPCQFEHFALMAAWGHPERAVVNPRTKAPTTPDCPAVTSP
jgi:hypothetical protein